MPKGKAKETEPPAPAKKTTTTATKEKAQASKKKKSDEEQRIATEKRITDPHYVKDITLSKEKLARRLFKVQNYLNSRKQEDEDEESTGPSLKIIASQLCLNHLIEHSDRLVRTRVACCLADIIYIHAGAGEDSVSYSEEQLQPIFKLFIDQIGRLEKSSDQLKELNKYILSKLAPVHAFELLPNVEELVVHMFQTFFNVIYGLRDSPDPAITDWLSKILITHLEDKESVVPKQLLEFIFETLTGRAKESDNKFLSNMILKTVDRLQEPFTKYLAGELEQQADTEQREKCHKIIFEVSRLAPNLLLYVMPQLEQQLTTENEEVRIDLVTLLSRIFSKKDSTLHTTYRKLFEAFLKRFGDINEHIRMTMLDFLGHYLLSQSDQVAELSALLASRLRDPSEDVRHKAVDIACTIVESRPEILTSAPIDELYLRLRDKKPSIRKELLQRLGRIYQTLCVKHGVDSSSWPNNIKRFRVIPSKIMQNYPLPGEELHVDTVMEEFLLSIPKQTIEAKTDMLVEFADILLEDPTSFAAFTRLIKEKRAFQNEFNKYLQANEDDDDVERLLRNLAITLVGGDKSKEHKILDHFNKMNQLKDKKVFAALTTLADTECTFSQQLAAKVDLINKIGKTHPISLLMAQLAQKLRLTVCTKETIPFLIARLNADIRAGSNFPVLKLLEIFTSQYPEFFKKYFQELSELLNKSAILDRAITILANVGSQFKIDAATGKNVSKKLSQLLSEGTSYQARTAVKALHALFPTSNAFGPILKELVEGLEGNENLGASIPALAQIAKLAPDQFSKQAKPVIEFIEDQVFTGKVSDPSPKKSKKKSPQKKPHSGDLKGFASKFLAKYLEGKHKLDKTESDDTARKYFALIVGVLETSTEACDDEDDESRRVDAVVSAASALLRIALIRRYEHLLTPQQFETLAWVARDKNSKIRIGFARKLLSVLKDVKLHVKYLAIAPLFVMDTQVAAQARAALAGGILNRRNFIKANDIQEKNPAAMAEILPEYAVPYLIHLIAHCPDFKDDEPLYHTTSKYVSFFVNEILHAQEHIIFLNMLLEGLRLTKDSVAPSSTAFQVVDEIALLTVKLKSDNRQWRAGKKFAYELLLPKTLFSVAAKATKPVPVKSYLPTGWKLPDQTKSMILGTGQPTKEEAEKSEKDKADKPDKPEKKAAKPKSSTPKRRLVYDKDDDAVTKKKKATNGTSTPVKSPHSLRARSIKSYFPTKATEDDEEEESEPSEEDEEEDYKKPAKKKGTTPPKSKTPPKKGKGKDDEEEATKKTPPKKDKGKQAEEEEQEQEVQEEEEEEAPAPKKGTAKPKAKEAEEVEEEEEEEAPAPKRGRGRPKAKQVEEEAEEEEEEEEEGKGNKKGGKTSKKGKVAARKRRKDEEEEEEEAESEGELGNNRKAKKVK